MIAPTSEACPGRGGAPAPDARLLQAEHDQAHRAADQDRAAIVDLRGTLLVVRLGYPDQHQGDDRHGDVDPEDRPPGPLREDPAGERPDRRQPARDAEEDRHRTAPLIDGKGGDHDRHRGREHQRGARALDDAEEDQPRFGDRPLRRQPAARRGDREHEHADHHHAPAAEHVAEPAPEGEQRRQRQQVAVDHPLRPGPRDRQLALELRDRDRHDRLVDERHRDGEHHRREDEVLRRRFRALSGQGAASRWR